MKLHGGSTEVDDAFSEASPCRHAPGREACFSRSESLIRVAELGSDRPLPARCATREDVRASSRWRGGLVRRTGATLTSPALPRRHFFGDIVIGVDVLDILVLFEDVTELEHPFAVLNIDVDGRGRDIAGLG